MGIKDNFTYKTSSGKYYTDKAEDFLTSKLGTKLKGKVQLIVTSPPFPLSKKKSYGNLNGEEYKNWFVNFATLFADLLTENGSIVIELGNAWEGGRPVQSLLPLEALLGFVNNRDAGLRLCQQFICHNPARLPSPAEWVTIKRWRTIDSFTNIWWMAKTDYPKADNSKVLRPYSKSMKNLLKNQKYNAGKRPSEHVIREKSFLKNNRGSIMPNVIEIESIDKDKERRLPENIFSISNTSSNDFFIKTCREHNINPHPARMPLELVCFFIEFLTDPGDIVLDPFAGSNTTGFCAEKLHRKWIAIETNKKYVEQSMVRFKDPSIKTKIIVKESEDL
ncbi:MAG: site-specific DNA-methyltransferase [Candidatus Eremiobacterota bacterium]